MRKNAFRFLVSILTSVLVASSLVSTSLATERTYNIKFVRNHTTARQLATKANDLRTKNAWYWDKNDKDKVYPQLGALEYDYALEEIAMQRAAELVFKEDVYRPDGTPYHTLMVGDVMSNGEIINAGCATVDEIFTRWARENDSYEYQGTRRRIMDADYNAFGVGHVKCGDRDYWVMEFGNEKSKYPAPSQVNNTVNYEWKFDDQQYYISPTFKEARIKIPMGQTTSINDIFKNACIYSADYFVCVPILLSECSFSAVSDDPSILKVEGNKLVPVKLGSTKLTVSVTWNGFTQTLSSKSLSVIKGADTTPSPTARPTVTPTNNPSNPTTKPTAGPTSNPSNPTSRPTTNPSNPTAKPTYPGTMPLNPTEAPADPTSKPSNPTAKPTSKASNNPQNDILAFVNRIYVYVLDRQPEEEGAKFWSDELYNFRRNGAEVAQGFIFSQEFYDRNTSDYEFVEILYRTFFDREPDESGMSYWLNMLSSGSMKWEDVANGFIYSQEWANTCASYGIRSGGTIKPTCVIEPTQLTYSFVERMYTTAMKRGYDAEGRAYWAAQLANFEITGEQVGASFFLSDEMNGYNLSDKEYILRLYKTFMDRDPDQGGLDYWLGFAKDHTRADLVYGFTRSPEFTDKCIEARILPY